jgi:hypothetical protein
MNRGNIVAKQVFTIGSNPRGEASDTHESGQIIVLLALAMAGLLVAAGLAVDGGMLFMRKAQLDRATDAAALAGVVDMYHADVETEAERVEIGNRRGLQLMAANEIPLTVEAHCDTVDWDVDEYCGDYRNGPYPGAVRYYIETRWETKTFFMPLIGITRVPLRSRAEAEYYALADIYASRTSLEGLLRSSNQSVFGPDICREYGDRYVRWINPGTPNPEWQELKGAYTYRIAIPDSYPYDEVRIELFDPDTINQTTTQQEKDKWDVFRRDGSFVGNLQCPDGNNPSKSRMNTCLLETGESVNGNPFWFIRVDENRGVGTVGACGTPSSYEPARNTDTLYRLFYYVQHPDSTMEQVDIAYYIGRSGIEGVLDHRAGAPSSMDEAELTDMHWVAPIAAGNEGELMPAFTGQQVVEAYPGYSYGSSTYPGDPDGEPAIYVQPCETFRAAHYTPELPDDPDLIYDGQLYTTAESCSPGNNDFIVNLNTETPDIYEVPGSGERSIYLEVRALNGSTENGFEVWAGPSRDVYEVPSDANARNMYILNALAARRANPLLPHPHHSHGISLFAIGHLPMNSNGTAEVDVPLIYMDPSAGGQEVTVELFDAQNGPGDNATTAPIYFYVDSKPVLDWSACYDDVNNPDGSPVSGNPDGIPCSEAGYDGGTVDLSSFYLDRAWIDYTADNPQGMNDTWVRYTFSIPTSNFYGGRLMAHYGGGHNDTYGWRIFVEGRPILVL